MEDTECMQIDAVTMTEDGRFDKLLLESIDAALSSLGESPKRAIYYHLEEHFHITKAEIPQKIPAFTTAIDEIFKLGSSHLKILVMKQIHEKIGGKLNWTREEGLTFPEYVTSVRQKFIEKRSCAEEIE